MAARTAVVAGTATAVSGRVARRQSRKYDQPAEEQPQEQQYLAPPPQQPAPAAAPEDDSLSGQIQEMAKLHTAGVISDAEFAAAKAKILGI